MNNKVKLINIVSIACRAGKVMSGEFVIEKALSSKNNIKLILLANDVADATNDKYEKMEKNPDIMQKFTDALQKGMDFVQSHTPEEIAEIIEPQFPETDLDTITAIIKRYFDQDTWKENLVFGQDGFELLQDILEDAGELKERTPYAELVNTEFAQNAS